MEGMGYHEFFQCDLHGGMPAMPIKQTCNIVIEILHLSVFAWSFALC
jgi:hypothetical protein